MHKILYVILDGLGDDPIPQFNGRTPLEEAKTPNLDSFARLGRTGVVTTVGEGIAPESDIAVMSILSYDPHKHHCGRGPLEALGTGLDFREGDVAWRANFATVDENSQIIDRRAGRDLSDDEAQSLAASINADVQLNHVETNFVATSEHRAVLHIRGKEKLNGEISNTDPAYERRGALGVALETFEPFALEAKALTESVGAIRAAEATNEWAQAANRVLADHEVNQARSKRNRPVANIVLLRDCGHSVPNVESISQKFGMKFACFAEMPVEIGISRILDMDPVKVGASGSDPQAYADLAQRALETLQGYDGLYVHIKGPDLPAHDGKFNEKRDCIAAIDEGFFGVLSSEMPGDVLLAVTADHSTSCVRKAHTDGPVPLLVVGRPVSSDGTQAFGESACRSGSIGHIHGTEILPMLAKIARDA